MGRQVSNLQEEEHVVNTVIAAVNAYGHDLRVVMKDGDVKQGRSCSMGIGNTSWLEPIRGYVELTDTRGVSEELDPLDIAAIQTPT